MIRSLVPWLIGWFCLAVVACFCWAWIKRPRFQVVLLIYGGVIKRRKVVVAAPSMGLKVEGETVEEVAENLIADPRFFGRTLATEDWQ